MDEKELILACAHEHIRRGMTDKATGLVAGLLFKDILESRAWYVMALNTTETAVIESALDLDQANAGLQQRLCRQLIKQNRVFELASLAALAGHTQVTLDGVDVGHLISGLNSALSYCEAADPWSFWPGHVNTAVIILSDGKGTGSTARSLAPVLQSPGVKLFELIAGPNSSGSSALSPDPQAAIWQLYSLTKDCQAVLVLREGFKASPEAIYRLWSLISIRPDLGICACLPRQLCGRLSEFAGRTPVQSQSEEQRRTADCLFRLRVAAEEGVFQRSQLVLPGCCLLRREVLDRALTLSATLPASAKDVPLETLLGFVAAQASIESITDGGSCVEPGFFGDEFPADDCSYSRLVSALNDSIKRRYRRNAGSIIYGETHMLLVTDFNDARHSKEAFQIRTDLADYKINVEVCHGGSKFEYLKYFPVVFHGSRNTRFLEAVPPEQRVLLLTPGDVPPERPALTALIPADRYSPASGNAASFPYSDSATLALAIRFMVDEAALSGERVKMLSDGANIEQQAFSISLPQTARPIESWAIKSNGKFTTLDFQIMPQISEASEMSRFMEAALALPPFYLHIGGIGDALLLLSCFYDGCAEAGVLSISNSTAAAEAVFDLFPKVTKVYGLQAPTTVVSNHLLRIGLANLPHFRGAGCTPMQKTHEQEWVPGLDIVERYGVNPNPQWVQGFQPKRLGAKQAVLAPMGSMFGMRFGWRNTIPVESWEGLANFLRDLNYTLVILGTPAERQFYPAPAFAVDARDATLRGQMEIIRGSDILVGADSWAKTFAALCGLPSFVFRPHNRELPLEALRHASDHIFIHPWPTIKHLASYEQCCSCIKALEASGGQIKKLKPVGSFAVI